MTRRRCFTWRPDHNAECLVCDDWPDVHVAVPLPDGLYRVSTPYLCAGFVVQGGYVTDCAPILQRRFSHWIARAQAIRLD